MRKIWNKRNLRTILRIPKNLLRTIPGLSRRMNLKGGMRGKRKPVSRKAGRDAQRAGT